MNDGNSYVDPDLRQPKPVVDAPRTWLISSFRFARRLTRV
jgi:hypothetical protein